VLKSLTINNIVLIDKAEINFSNGLCILSGETGSGKSILLDALGLAIGFRSNMRLIGREENKAQVLAEFDISNNSHCQNILEENDLLNPEDPNSLIIRRKISADATSKAFVNDTPIGINLLARIGETLVEIHGQHDQRGLLNVNSHLAILDQFAGNDSLLKDIKTTYKNLKNIEGIITDLKNKKEQVAREKDYLEHVVQELESADIQPEEEEHLIVKKDLLSGKGKIIKFLGELNSQLTEANSNLINAQRTVLRNQNIINNFLAKESEDFEILNEKIDKNNSDLDAAIASFQNMVRNVSHSEDSLEEIDERLFTLRNLARKHGKSSDQLYLIIEDAQEKLKLIAGDEESEVELEVERKALVEKYQNIADKLSTKRKKSAIILAKKAEEELKFLKMEGVKFLIKLSNGNSQISANGLETARFTAAINNDNFDDISKIASGGELSRFMLALKVSLLGVNSTPTIIFDEIDTGIGGSTADAVGKRLKILANNLQVLVVTHQAQIASKADNHFKISKVGDKQINTKIETLNKEDRQQEIARMLSGEIVSDEALAAAKSLIGS
jgi:DNA repair protein RecN (Recombination protein N)